MISSNLEELKSKTIVLLSEGTSTSSTYTLPALSDSVVNYNWVYLSVKNAKQTGYIIVPKIVFTELTGKDEYAANYIGNGSGEFVRMYFDDEKIVRVYSLSNTTYRLYGFK